MNQEGKYIKIQETKAQNIALLYISGKGDIVQTNISVIINIIKGK